MVLNLRESSSPVQSSDYIQLPLYYKEVKVGLCLIQNKPTCRKNTTTLNSYMLVDHYGTALLILKSFSI